MGYAAILEIQYRLTVTTFVDGHDAGSFAWDDELSGQPSGEGSVGMEALLGGEKDDLSSI